MKKTVLIAAVILAVPIAFATNLEENARTNKESEEKENRIKNEQREAKYQQAIKDGKISLLEGRELFRSRSYFAYADAPGDAMRLSGILLLSRSPCADKKAAKDKWFHAVIFYGVYRGEDRLQLACWGKHPEANTFGIAKDIKDVVNVCYTDVENGEWILGNFCGPWLESSFADTDSLPKSANFPK